jgi:RecB family exonuclease
LARLAAADVPGADPDEWWGLPPISDSRPMIDPDSVVRVSPSTVEGVLRCGLRWLLERHGGSEPATAKQGIGNLVHDAATKAAIAGTTAEELRQHVLTHFEKIEMPAVWLGQRERERATAMVDKLVAWLTANPRRLIDVERAFRSELAQTTDSGNRVELNGRVDRLEQDEQGRLVVIDLKTGGSAPSAKDTAEHAQLAAYQVAVEVGAFPEGMVPGGAEIVALGTTSGDAVVREQPPLAQADDPRWAEALVLRAASAMAASTVSAVVNDSCGYCAVRTSCPVSGKGRQVIDE